MVARFDKMIVLHFGRNTVVTICALSALCIVYLTYMYPKGIDSSFIQRTLNEQNSGKRERNFPINTDTIKCTNREVVHHETPVEDAFDFKKAMDELNAAKVSQDDPRLIELIRKYYLVSPSDKAYNLEFPDILDLSIGQAPFVDNRLNFLECGFFVECGAHNGEWGTNTLFFERFRKWSGLLVEADPNNFAKLKSKNRKAYLVNACLNTEPYPSMRTFKMASNLGRIAEGDPNKDKRIVNVQCFPLYSILRAIGQDRVDFFSLDVEGDEMGVLGTIPWDRVDIRMMTVEYVHGKGEDMALKKYAEDIGYDALLKVSHYGGRANDLIFKRKEVK